jgi:hypothetical protein
MLDARLSEVARPDEDNNAFAVLHNDLRMILRDLGVNSASAIKPAAIELKARA